MLAGCWDLLLMADVQQISLMRANQEFFNQLQVAAADPPPVLEFDLPAGESTNPERCRAAKILACELACSVLKLLAADDCEEE